MNLLALDTSTNLATVALSFQGKVFSLQQEAQREHAHCVLGMTTELLENAAVSIAQIDGIVFGSGPGSFTGLRIACSIAKAWSYAHDLPMYAVDGLSAIAHTCNAENDNILAVIDARMGQLYWAFFEDGIMQGSAHVNNPADIHIPGNEKFILAGVAYEAYAELFNDEIKKRISASIPVFPTAEAMIALVKNGNITPTDAALAEPIYVRNQITQGESRG